MFGSFFRNASHHSCFYYRPVLLKVMWPHSQVVLHQGYRSQTTDCARNALVSSLLTVFPQLISIPSFCYSQCVCVYVCACMHIYVCMRVCAHVCNADALRSVSYMSEFTAVCACVLGVHACVCVFPYNT